MEKYFVEEVNKTVKDIKNNFSEGDICFAMLTDSHLSDSGMITRENISAVDKSINFDFIVHMGGIINGNNPKNVSMHILSNEIEKYKNSIVSKKIFVIPGEKDGYRNERFAGQLALNIMTDELWYRKMSYLDGYENISRVKNKPYYYVDCPDKKIRFIFLSSYITQIDEKHGLFEKYRSFGVEQLAWLKESALDLNKGYSAGIFSNAIPKSRYETGEDPYIYNGYSTEQTLAIIQQAKARGINICCWFAGYYNCDDESVVGGVNFAVIGSQLPSTKAYSKYNNVRIHTDRTSGINSDLWDAVLIKQNERRVYIYRFGAGEDRVIEY